MIDNQYAYQHFVDTLAKIEAKWRRWSHLDPLIAAYYTPERIKHVVDRILRSPTPTLDRALKMLERKDVLRRRRRR